MKPILVLQMQRMGDIILSFPLLGTLQKLYPNNPIWTVAEPTFFLDLMQFSPSTTFFPPEAQSQLQNVEFHSIINLSHRSEAAKLAGSLNAEHYYGAHTTEKYSSVNGAWSLYRASIVHNNRYNLFHWSDLQILNHQNVQAFRNIALSTKKDGKAKIGIFVGASEKEKRPTPEFFAKLAQILLRKHYQPLFLGGPDDVAIGNEAMRLSGLNHASLCGKLSLVELANVLQELNLLITPDTGPMHLAAWLKTPVLNISIGPVNPWETGPFFPNNYILQPSISCAGCWQACPRTPCQQKLNAGRVALIAQSIIEAPKRLENLEINDLNIYRTARDTQGLFNLVHINKRGENPRLLLAKFWKAWFYYRLGQGPSPKASLEDIHNHYPYLIDRLAKAIVHLGLQLQRHLKNVFLGKEFELSNDFWKKLPKPIQPFSGYIHLFLQNKNYSREAWDEVLQEIDALSQVLA